MTDLTVACVWVDGHVPYSDAYVVNLERMVRRHLQRPFRFVCLTDRPLIVPRSIETIKVAIPQGCRAWWTKLELFNPALGLKGRILYLDLDVVIAGGLDEIVDYPIPFTIAPHAGDFRPRGFEVVPRYNSSVMVWDTSLRSVSERLWDRWTPDVAEMLWGDQDWIGQELPFETTMPLRWFPRFSEIDPETGPAPVAKIVLCKKPKNHLAAARSRWVAENWR